MDAIKSQIVGHYDMRFAENHRAYNYWELREDGKAIENNKEVGTWTVTDGLVAITYNNKDFGHAVLSLEDENTLVGENVWKSGNTFHWTLRRALK